MWTRKKTIKSILGVAIFLFVLAAAYIVFFAGKISSLSEKVTLNPHGKSSVVEKFRELARSDSIDLRGAEKGRINILLLGIAGKGKAGQNLTDTIMIASLNTQTKQVALMSLPRDLYVKIPKSDISLKINSAYQYGLNSSKSQSDSIKIVGEIINDVTALKIDYYVILNFEGFEKAIDAIGGVNVINEWDIFDSRYPGPNYSYETFKLEKGFHHLSGHEALKYARVRHGDPQGDFGRAKRQQQIMQSFKNKVFSLKTWLNVFALNDLLNALGENVKTDVEAKDLDNFLKISKKIDTENVNNVVVDAWNKDSLLKVSHIYSPSGRIFVLVPRAGNWSEISELAENIFDLNRLKRRREEIERENATVSIINKSGNPLVLNRIKKLPQDNFKYKNIIVLNDRNKSLEESTFSYDLTNGEKPFTLDELVIKLPSRASYELPSKYLEIARSTKSEIVIVIGKDLIDRYNMEEDSLEEYNQASDTNEYQEFIKKMIPTKLIIGLGNPGKKYTLTRHNTGFIALDKIRSAWDFPAFELNKKFGAEVSISSAPGKKIILAKPQDYMNNSGRSVKEILNFYKIMPENLIVIHDDIDIELGKYKVSANSRPAGHNGVEDIINKIGTQKFTRIRIGVANEKLRSQIDPSDFVLQKFDKEELKIIIQLPNILLGEIKRLAVF